jgi:hypothetical protein
MPPVEKIRQAHSSGVLTPDLVHWVTALHEHFGTITTLQSCGFFEAEAQFLNASSSAASFV